MSKEKTEKHPMADYAPELKVTKVNEHGASVVLKNVRLNFVYLDKPSKSIDGNPEKDKYSVTAIIPQKYFDKLSKEFARVFEQALKVNKRLPTAEQRVKALKTAMDHGEHYSFFKIGNDQKDKEGNVRKGLENAYTVQAAMAVTQTENGPRPKFSLSLLNAANEPIPLHDLRAEFYSGIWADIALTLSPYEYMKKQSIKAYLDAVRKLADDEKLSGVSNPFGEARDDLPSAAKFDGTDSDFSFDEEEAKPARKGKK